MEEAILLLGSNLGERERYLGQARNLITEKAGEITALSSIYESEPWGFEDKNQFLNQAIKISTQLSPQQLIETLLAIEQLIGRIRTGQISSRVIDIDILFYGDQSIESEVLTVPHPRIAERLFTLLPLSDLTEKAILPILNKTAQELIDDCKDESEIFRLIR